MKKIKIFFLYTLFLTQISHGLQEPIRTFAEFARTFAAPEHVENMIKQSKNMNHFLPLTTVNLSLKDPDWCEQSSSPLAIKTATVYPKKDEIDRVVNAATLRSIIKQNNLNTLTVPKKYVCEHHNGWVVVAKGVISDLDDRPYSLEEVKHLIILQEIACYNDMYPRNIIRNKKNNKISIIDTENLSFNSSHAGQMSKIECMQILQTHIAYRIDNKGYELVRDRIEELKKDEQNHVPINWVKKLQNPEHTGIDFESVQQDYQNLKAARKA